MDSKTIYEKIMANQENMDPYLSNQGAAPGYFKDRVNEAFQGNLPAIQNAAALEARAYSLPGELMGQYDQEYGGNTGLSSMSRMNSILKNIGTQFGTSNAAWNVVDQAKVRQADLANSMMQQYLGELGAHESRHGMLSPLWQQLYGEEQAMERLQAQIAANRRPAPPTSTWPGIETIGDPEPTPGPTAGGGGSRVPSSLANLIDQEQEARKPVETGSRDLDRLINNWRGVEQPTQFKY